MRGPRPKVTDEIASEIRAAVLAGMSQCAVARKYGLCDATVSRIVNGKLRAVGRAHEIEALTKALGIRVRSSRTEFCWVARVWKQDYADAKRILAKVVAVRPGMTRLATIALTAAEELRRLRAELAATQETKR